MRYQQPFDQPSNPNASYVNGNPATATPGSIPPAAAFEEPQREIVNFITDSNLAPSDGDLHQISRGVQSSAVITGTDTGTKNAMVVALQPVPAALTLGMSITVKKIGTANDGPVTLNIGLGANPVHLANGSALSGGELPAGCMYEYVWDGSAWQTKNFQGISVSGGSTTNTYTLAVPYCVDTSVVANTITAPFSPALTSLAAGDMIKIKIANTVTGATAVTVNALPPITAVRPDGTPIRAGDMVAGQIVLFEFDGTVLQAANLAPLGNFIRGVPTPWLTEVVPAGTLECNGASISRSTYAALFAIWGARFGSVDGSHFNLPDLRGQFLRGWNHGAGTDPDAAARTNRGDGTTGDHVGTLQGFAASFGSATVTLNNPKLQTPVNADVGYGFPNALIPFGADSHGFGATFGGTGVFPLAPAYVDADGGPIPPLSKAIIISSTGYGSGITGIVGTISVAGGGDETRPVNFSVMYVVAF